MSDRTAKTIVLLAGAFMFAAIGLKRSSISDPYRYAWGAGVITLGLTVLADISPEIAGPFALLVLVAVYWKNRGVLGQVVPSPPSHTGGATQSGTANRTAKQTFGAG